MNKIADLRKRAGLSQRKLGLILGGAQNTVCNWEKGTREPDFHSLQQMSELFHVTVDYLLFGQDKPVSNAEQPPAPASPTEEQYRDEELFKAYKSAPENVQEAIRSLLGLK